MVITFEVLSAVHECCCWDGAWDEALPELDTRPGTVSEAMHQALTLITQPTFFVLRWDQARWFIEERIHAFSSSLNRDFESNYGANPALYAAGYLGTFKGVPVISSVYADLGFLTNAEHPLKVSYSEGVVLLRQVLYPE